MRMNYFQNSNSNRKNSKISKHHGFMVFLDMSKIVESSNDTRKFHYSVTFSRITFFAQQMQSRVMNANTNIRLGKFPIWLYILSLCRNLSQGRP